jgi:hypothetical protein
VEVEQPAQVALAGGRLAAEGLATLDQQETTCCYAVQDKVWVEDPDATPWEIYTVLADSPVQTGIAGEGTCGADGDSQAGAATGAVAAGNCC